MDDTIVNFPSVHWSLMTESSTPPRKTYLYKGTYINKPAVTYRLVMFFQSIGQTEGGDRIEIWERVGEMTFCDQTDAQLTALKYLRGHLTMTLKGE